ncbi:MAG: type VI secretion system baseplate subunit TssE [Pseudomonadota bacterium]|nr:type VI secretion system baseplate subunit TssE [Pseudomonadota bacterium]
MSTFSSTVWDRLIEPIHPSAGHQNPMRLSLAQYKRNIARDLEVLLNTRVAILAEELAPYPACRDSIVNFGLADFAKLCLTSSEERKEICDRLTAAIARHEPRLTQVRAHLVDETGMVNRLSFAISAQLRALEDDDRVRFDVMLESSSLHYSIR